jgi:predicted Zn-dependent peptidase
MPFSLETLDSGLSLAMEPMQGLHSAAAAFVVMAGSRDEAPDEWGFSHFIEHMCFKSTPHRSAIEISRAFDELGAETNASTDVEGVDFHVWVQADRLEPALDLLAEVVYGHRGRGGKAAFNKKEFATEKEVVLSEISMYDDSPEVAAGEALMALAWADHPLGRSVQGVAKTVAAADLGGIGRFYLDRYAPANMALVVTGAFDPDRVREQARRITAPLRGKPRVAKRAIPKFHPGRKIIQRPDVSQEYILLAAPLSAASDEGWAEIAVIARALGGGANSRLYWRLVEPGLAGEASASAAQYSDAGQWEISLCAEPESAREALTKARAEISGFAGLASDEIMRAKETFATDLASGGEHPLARIASHCSAFEKRVALRSHDQLLAAVDRVTAEGVAEVLGKWPMDATQAVSAVGPMETRFADG